MKAFGFVAGVGCAVLLAIGVPAFAGAGTPALGITQTEATFQIPEHSGASIFTLNLWNSGTLVGTSSGTSGTLTVSVPNIAGCAFQADVRQDGRYLMGKRATFTSCGPVPSTTTSTSTTTTSPATAPAQGVEASPPPATGARGVAPAVPVPITVQSGRVTFTG
jgi:hypothetical protein